MGGFFFFFLEFPDQELVAKGYILYVVGVEIITVVEMDLSSGHVYFE
jgi:hypothetical protein